MAPSRGNPATAPPHPASSSDEAAVIRHGDSALASAKRNFRFLIDPSSPTSPKPSRLRTRALLRSLRYIGIFIFWRVVCYARYLAIGSLAALVSGTVVGSMVGWVGFLVAPPTIGASVLAGTIWGAGKWGARRLQRRWERGGVVAAEGKKSGGGGGKETVYRKEPELQAVPW